MVHPFKQYRIDRLFFSSMALFIVLLLLASSWVSYFLTSRELMVNTADNQQGLLEELNRQVAATLQSIEEISLSVAGSRQLEEFLNMKSDGYSRFSQGSQIESYLANTVYSTPIIQSIYLYMDNPVANQLNFVSYLPLAQAQNESWYASLESDQFAWIGEHAIQTDNGPASVISFARKVLPPLRPYSGLLVINVKASELRNLLVGEGADYNGLVLYYRGKPVVSAGNARLNDSIDRFLFQANESVGHKRVGDLLLVWSGFPDSDWRLVEQTPWQRLSSWSLRLAESMAVTGLAAILLALILALALSKQFIRPVRTLLAAMGQFAIHNEQTDLPSDYRNEFGALFAGFIRMRNRINDLYRSLEEQYRRQKVVEIERLQAMINPHFLYNTLDQVNWMALDAGQEEISHVLALMGRMFRIGLSDGESFILIAKEKEYLECYLLIQNLRLKGAIAFRLELEDALLLTYIPKLILQPFIENAVRHGFHGLATGTVTLIGQECSGGIRFTIQDDGLGFHPMELSKRRRTGGYGIRNVKERIEAYFGAPYGVDIHSEPGYGTKVTVFLPKIESIAGLEEEDEDHDGEHPNRANRRRTARA